MRFMWRDPSTSDVSLSFLFFSLLPSADHKFSVLLAVFLDVELSIECESLFCRVIWFSQNGIEIMADEIHV